MPPLCRETQSLGQQMLNAPVGINGLREADPKLVSNRYKSGSSSLGRKVITKLKHVAGHTPNKIQCLEILIIVS